MGGKAAGRELEEKKGSWSIYVTMKKAVVVLCIITR